MENRLCNVISVDLGTTYSTACCINAKGNLEVLEDENGFPYIPSVVSYGNPILVGTAAEKKKIMGKPDTIYESKRIMAKDFNDPVVQNLIPFWPFTIVEGEQHRAGYKLVIKGEESVIYPEQVAADIINYFCELAEKKTGRPIDQIIITVPAFFDSNQRLATIQAVEFYKHRTCVLLLDEPSAAAVAFSVENDLENKTLVVFDLGGGTFDVSLMKIEDKQYNVIRLDGDSNLGGATFNNLLYGVIVKRIREGMENPQREFTMKEEATIHAVCEQIKTNLSSITFQEMDVELEDEDIHIEVTRTEFEDLIRPLISKAIQITLNCIREAGMDPSQIDYVAMIGGSTSIPLIRTMLESTFPMSKVARSGDVRTAVARGAFIRLIEYMKSEELRRRAESGQRERFVMPAQPRTAQEVAKPNEPGYVVVEDNGYVVPERDNGFVVPNRDNGFVLPERNSGYVVPVHSGYVVPDNTSSGFVVPDNTGSGFVVPDNTGSGFVVPDHTDGGFVVPDNTSSGFVVPDPSGGGSAVPENTSSGYVVPDHSGYVVPEEGGVTVSQNPSTGYVIPEEGGVRPTQPSPGGFVVPDTESATELEPRASVHPHTVQPVDYDSRPVAPVIPPLPDSSPLKKRAVVVDDPVVPVVEPSIELESRASVHPHTVQPVDYDSRPVAPATPPIVPATPPIVPATPIVPAIPPVVPAIPPIASPSSLKGQSVDVPPDNPPVANPPVQTPPVTPPSSTNPAPSDPLPYSKPEEGGVVPSSPSPRSGFVVHCDVSVVGLDVGIKVKGGKMFVMVPRGTPLPFDSKPHPFSCDASHPVDIIVYQGNRPFATDNQRIGSTKTTIDTAYGTQKGRFYLRISVDRNNIVRVYRSYDKQDWRVLHDMENSLVFSEETIQKMRQKAEEWKELDELFMKWIDVRNHFEMVLNQYMECSDKPGYNQEKADAWSKWFNDYRSPPPDGIITEEIMSRWTSAVEVVTNEVQRILSMWVVCLEDRIMSTNTFAFVSLLVWSHVRQ